MLNIFIGYDAREKVAYNVLQHSIRERATIPISITPLDMRQLRKQLWRPRHPLQSTDFAFSRFLAPALCGFSGWSLFMDCDMLCLADVAELWELRDPTVAVQCVQHFYEPKTDRKFLDQPQTRYARKNWSSVMIFNNPRCHKLTLEYVNEAEGLDLHGFKWIEDGEIGRLSHVWNHLVGEFPYNPAAKLVHFTCGGPWFDDWHDVDYAEAWRNEWNSAYSLPFATRSSSASTGRPASNR